MTRRTHCRLLLSLVFSIGGSAASSSLAHILEGRLTAQDSCRSILLRMERR